MRNKKGRPHKNGLDNGHDLYRLHANRRSLYRIPDRRAGRQTHQPGSSDDTALYVEEATTMTDNVNSLFPLYAQCVCCRDLGIWLGPSGRPLICPQMQTGAVHNLPGPAASIVQRSIRRLGSRNVNAHLFDLARHLTRATSEAPCERDEMLRKYFSYTVSPLRKFHQTIEDLRSSWLLPVGSRKDAPAGYWIITDLADFKDWYERAKAAPITQLATIHRVARANFPVFAEQMEFEFWTDLEARIEPAGIPAA
jgi:hypothetical protein